MKRRARKAEARGGADGRGLLKRLNARVRSVMACGLGMALRIAVPAAMAASATVVTLAAVVILLPIGPVIEAMGNPLQRHRP